MSEEKKHGGWPEAVENIGCGFLLFAFVLALVLLCFFNKEIFDLAGKLVQ